MYFVDRITLGNMLADKLGKYRGKGAVIVCLKESSLLTCLTIAKRLRAWVYPLVFSPVYGPDGTHVLLGAFDQDGVFCALEDDQTVRKGPAEVKHVVDKQQPFAQATIKHQQSSYGLKLNKRLLDGRDVIIAGDVLTATLPVKVAQQLLMGVRPKSLTAVAGNVTTDVAQLLRISADESVILDILSGVTYDDDHYFERTDTYSLEQKRRVTQHIAAYWQ